MPKTPATTCASRSHARPCAECIRCVGRWCPVTRPRCKGLCRCQALELIANLPSQVLYPTTEDVGRGAGLEQKDVQLNFYARHLNPEQRDAVSTIFRSLHGIVPFVLFGPPGAHTAVVFRWRLYCT